MIPTDYTGPPASPGVSSCSPHHASRRWSGLAYAWAIVVAVLLLTAFASPARGETYVWTGAAPSAAWSAAANWQGGVAPNIGDAVLDVLVFPAAAAAHVITNDFPTGTGVARLVFNGAYVVNGAQLRIRDGIEVALDGTGTVDINNNLLLDGILVPNTVVISTNGPLRLDGVISGSTLASLRKEGLGAVALSSVNPFQGTTVIAEGAVELFNAHGLGATAAGTTVLPGGTLRLSSTEMIVDEPIKLTGTADGSAPAALENSAPDGGGDGNVLTKLALAGDGAPRIWINDPSTLTVVAPIVGPVGVERTGGGMLALTGDAANTFGGAVTVTGGLVVLATNGHPATPNGLDLRAGTVRLARNDTIAGVVSIGTAGTLNLNNFSDVVSGLNGTGTVQLGSGSLTLLSGTESTFSGTISGTGKLVKSGGQLLTLEGTQTFTGGMLIANGGRVRVDGSLASAVTLYGFLYGSGTIGALAAEHGLLSPGAEAGGLGVLRTADLATSNSLLVGIHVHGTAPGTGHDQLRVQGSVTLNFPNLEVLVATGFTPSNSGLVIIDNDGTDPVNGQFADLPEGATTVFGGRAFRISYVGGTGNDVVLTPLVTEYHLSEGATGKFFDTDLLLANPHEVEASVEVLYLRRGVEPQTQTLTMPPLSRVTIRVDDQPGLEDAEVSFIVRSMNLLPLVVERTMRWDAAGYGAHTEKAVAGPAERWYFAEGAQGFFSTYLLLANPHVFPNSATVTYLREGASPIVRDYPLEPTARLTIDTSADLDLVGQAFGMLVTFSMPGVAERAMYFGQSPLWNAGHESAGVPSLATTWFLAEGATGPFFETFVLLANPNDVAAEATVTFLPMSGEPIVKKKTVPARGRLTLNIEAEDAALANAAVATRVDASLPIVAERAQYWPDPAPQWYEAHNSFGVTEVATSWGLAEGRVGGPEAYQTFVLIANPGDVPATVTLRFLREGRPAFTKSFTVNPTSRFNVTTGPGSLVPELQDERFGVAITASVPVIVERAMYADAGGQLWGAGTNATATRLP